MYYQIFQEIERRGLEQMKLIRKVPPKITHKLPVIRIQLVFEWLEGLSSSEKFPFDKFCMVARSRSDLAFKSARTCQDTLRDLLINRVGHS